LYHFFRSIPLIKTEPGNPNLNTSGNGKNQSGNSTASFFIPTLYNKIRVYKVTVVFTFLVFSCKRSYVQQLYNEFYEALLCFSVFSNTNMTKIGLLSDTHGFLDEKILVHFNDCDEVWHAGDFGHGITTRLKAFKKLRGVYGNIDEPSVRAEFPEQLVFMCEEVNVLIRHIGGSPPRYNPETRKAIIQHKPQLFVCGHSHILKVMFDAQLHCLYMNPGAAGSQGWHKVRTILRFEIDGKKIQHCEVIELGTR
jgi:hypothetical protein